MDHIPAYFRYSYHETMRYLFQNCTMQRNLIATMETTWKKHNFKAAVTLNLLQ